MFGAHFVGLAGRMVLLNLVRSLVALAGFGALGFAIVQLQSASAQADHSDLVLAQSNQIERSVLDLETGVRGYQLTLQGEFLAPTRNAESRLPNELDRLRALVRNSPGQEARARALTASIAAYRRSWVEPTLRRGGLQDLTAITTTGKQKVDALRSQFAVFASVESKLRATRKAHVRFVEDIVAGLVLTVLLVLGGASLLTARWTRRRVIVPLLELRHVLQRFGAGSLDARVKRRGFAEIGNLEASFNTMADELAASRRESDRLAAALERQTRTDVLTGLANRRYFDEQLERACANARRHETPLSLLSLDIDRFKLVNDTLGHAAGDRVLKTVAAVFRSNTRAGDLVARVGGDEFAVLLPHTHSSGADALAQQIRRALAESTGNGDGGTLVTISIGVACAKADAGPDQLVNDADAAMYANKRRLPVAAPG